MTLKSNDCRINLPSCNLLCKSCIDHDLRPMPNLSQPIYGAPIVSRETRSEAHNCALCIAYRDLYIIYIYVCCPSPNLSCHFLRLFLCRSSRTFETLWGCPSQHVLRICSFARVAVLFQGGDNLFPCKVVCQVQLARLYWYGNA